MAYSYDDTNIFARILRGEIPCSKVLETEHALAFNDIAPQAAPGDGGLGYRLVANTGEAGVQDVPHLHVHILGGRVLGRMLPAAQ